MGVYNDMYKMGAMVIAMSDAMEILYAYAKEELLPSYLPSPEYREVSRLTARLSLRLRDLLPDDSWNTVEKYEDAAAQLLRTSIGVCACTIVCSVFKVQEGQ